MSSKRRLRRNACDGKRRFMTVGAALSAIKKLARQNGARHPETLRAYHCRFCHGFHFGHRGTPLASASAITSSSTL